jgi:DNA modification methylase
MTPERNKITCADVLDYLRSLPDKCVDCVITSPPYYGLRDYSANGQIGLEPTLREYIEAMVVIFFEVMRVLKPTGTCWVNMGDSYNSSPAGKNPGGFQGAAMQRNDGYDNSQPRSDKSFKGGYRDGLKPKDLMLVPHRLAIALQEAGWWVRSDIVWHKPNPMPESVTDRPTKSHEYVFLLTKRARYFYDQEAVRESHLVGTGGRQRAAIRGSFVYSEVSRKYKSRNTTPESLGNANSGLYLSGYNPAGRNRRSVWTIATESFSGAHFAAFPQKLVEPCLLAGCPREVCAECGAPVVRVVEIKKASQENRNKIAKETGWGFQRGSRDLREGESESTGRTRSVQDMFDSIGKTRTTTGFRPTCDCNAGFVPGLVLDPFMGSGTVALVAIRHGRDYIGCDISPEYVAMAERRIADFDPFQPVEHETGEVQLSLFG